MYTSFYQNGVTKLGIIIYVYLMHSWTCLEKNVIEFTIIMHHNVIYIPYCMERV